MARTIVKRTKRATKQATKKGVKRRRPRGLGRCDTPLPAYPKWQLLDMTYRAAIRRSEALGRATLLLEQASAADQPVSVYLQLQRTVTCHETAIAHLTEKMAGLIQIVRASHARS